MSRRARLADGEPTEPYFFRAPSKALKKGMTVMLAAAIVGLVAVAVLVAVLAPTTPLRTVTLPAADRAASPTLRTAAEALHFRPDTKAATIEGKPASAAFPADPSLLPVGTKAPAFALRTPTGAKISLASLRGKAVLLEFFATWCPHCAAEAPHLRSLANSLAGKHVAFVSVNADSEDAPSVFAYHVYFGLPFPALVDGGSRPVSWPDHGPLGAVSDRYRVSLFPTFYVLDSRGRIAWRSAGEQPDALLRQELLRAG